MLQRAVTPLLLAILLTLSACGSSPTTSQPTTEASAPDTAARPTRALPTARPRHTATPEATRTPRPPTATPGPTDTPEPPTAEPTPIILSGAGLGVTDPVRLPRDIMRAVLVHDGQRNFIVKMYSDAGEQLLVNEIGRFTGKALVSADSEVFFEVNADGGWVISFQELGINEEHDAAFSGSGMDVSSLFTPDKSGPVTYDVTHDGSSNFIVKLLCGGGVDFVTNEIGAMNGSVVVDVADGPCLWEVNADGNWSITRR